MSGTSQRSHMATKPHSRHTTGGATPVEIEDGLLSPAQNLFKFGLQTAADDAGVACMQFIAQVDDLDRGERGSDAIAQFN